MIDYELVNEFIGKPWVYIENDCYSVVKKASKLIFGREIIDNIEFSASPGKGETSAIVNKQTALNCWAKVEQLRPGNVIVFSDRKNNPTHIGICIERDNVLHCLGGPGVKNGKTRYDPINTIKLMYPTHEVYAYVDHSS